MRHQRRPLPFFSERQRLDADLHIPPDGSATPPFPVLVACSGFQGRKSLHPERFARGLAPLGYAVLAFDYRGVGESEGEYGRQAPQDWAEDVRAAVDCMMGEPQVDSRRIGLLGWALGGSVAIAEAAGDPRVAAVAAVNSMASGDRCLRGLHDDGAWQRLLARAEADRELRVTGGRSQLVSPWEIVPLDFDRSTQEYVDETSAIPSGFGHPTSLESADMMMRFRPEEVVGDVAPRPLLVVHGSENRLHPPEEAQALYDHAGEPRELVFLKGAGHTDWMEDRDPTFRHLNGLLDDFFSWGPGGLRDVHRSRRPRRDWNVSAAETASRR